MTERQLKFFYFPAWGRCADANDWRMEKGRMRAERSTDRGTGATADLFAKVWSVAEQLAGAEHRAVKPDDLRRGCHVVAIQRNKSSKDLTNNEVERVVALFRVLTDPDNLDFVMDWEHPDRATQRNLVAAIKRKAEEAYICKIAGDKFRGQFEYPYWEDLKIWQLRQLAVTLNERAKKWSEPVSREGAKSAKAAVGIEQPF